MVVMHRMDHAALVMLLLLVVMVLQLLLAFEVAVVLDVRLAVAPPVHRLTD